MTETQALELRIVELERKVASLLARGEAEAKPAKPSHLRWLLVWATMIGVAWQCASRGFDWVSAVFLGIAAGFFAFTVTR